MPREQADPLHRSFRNPGPIKIVTMKWLVLAPDGIHNKNKAPPGVARGGMVNARRQMSQPARISTL